MGRCSREEYPSKVTNAAQAQWSALCSAHSPSLPILLDLNYSRSAPQMTHRSPSSFPTIRLMKLQVGNKMIKGWAEGIICKWWQTGKDPLIYRFPWFFSFIQQILIEHLVCVMHWWAIRFTSGFQQWTCWMLPLLLWCWRYRRGERLPTHNCRMNNNLEKKNKERHSTCIYSKVSVYLGVWPSLHERGEMVKRYYFPGISSC